jgi:type IV pilus secretin PilQ/predicted competence protein
MLKNLVSFLIFSLVCAPNVLLAQDWAAVSPQEIEISPEKSDLEKRLDRKISLDYKNADLASILRSFAWTYDLNIVTGPDVKGTVTINLKDITVGEALKAILTINGLAYSEREGVIYISVGDPKTVELESEVIFLKYISASEAQNFLREVISANGDMKINEVANSLIITDFIGNIKKAKGLLAKIDVAPKQVLIEAKIVDITSNDLAALGVTWDADYNPGRAIFDRTTNANERLKSTITMGEQSSDLTGGQFVLDTLTFKNLTMTGTLDALVKDGKANLLATPSIAVINGEEARIIIGERYPYKERTQTTSGTTETTKFVDIGTALRVTPQINEDNYITMRVHPEVSSLAESLDAGPRVTTREADTTVRVKEGETLVIGGLIKKTDERSSERVPILGSIPIIGFLFSRSEKDVEQKELAVFITPKILRSREELKLLSKKQAEKQAVYVNIEKTAQLNVVESIFDKARKLDRNKAVESVRKSEQFRKAQALSLYEHVFVEFPDAERSPESMYRAGMIYYKYIKDYDKTRDILARLISDYPDTLFANKARKIHKKISLPLKKVRGAREVDLRILMED